MIQRYFSLVTFSHTIFAMPFAMVGLFLGFRDTGQIEISVVLLVIACMVFARNAAMAFNRYADRRIDERNARTAIRDIPAGRISARSALLFVVINALLFVAATWFINPLCFYLSPVALAVVLGYSYTKRFTAFCHLVLGLGLSLAPVGAYLAATGFFALPVILYGLLVLLWVSGFDIIYSLQDVDFDKNQRLHSIPVALGRSDALRLSALMHSGVVVLLFMAGYFAELHWVHWIGVAVFTAMLIWQHSLVSVNDLSSVNRAFFTTNGIASLVFGTAVLTDILLYEHAFLKVQW